jgi:hypothetical protein
MEHRIIATMLENTVTRTINRRSFRFFIISTIVFLLYVVAKPSFWKSIWNNNSATCK